MRTRATSAADTMRSIAPGRVDDEASAERTSAGRWSVEFGVGVISDNTPDVYYKFSLQPDRGPGAGQTYNLTVARRIAEFDWKVGRNTHVRPQLEVPVRLTLVDQKEGGLLPDVNAGVALRWRNWPWNRLISTTLAVGGGLSYSTRVWTADGQRHPAQHRSPVKLWMPVELTAALPRYPNFQLIGFGDHHSGGAIFDSGGVEAWGLGARVVF